MNNTLHACISLKFRRELTKHDVLSCECYLTFKDKVFTSQWRKQWHPTPVLLPGKSHGWRSLEGCSPWGRWGSDTAEWFPFHFSLSCIGEGNGNPLQCSCLENPRDGGAWWAAIYGVAESRTRLKWLSSSNLPLNGVWMSYQNAYCYCALEEAQNLVFFHWWFPNSCSIRLVRFNSEF